MPTLLRRPAVAALLIGIAAQLLFSINLARPSQPVFDEVHYLPAARMLLTLERPVNTEHPLFGKELIATGMSIFGDNAVGWRAASTVAGTATVLGVFAILILVFGSLRAASYGALFTALNFTVFIQARIAMLEVFLGAFVTLGSAALIWAMRAPLEKVERRWILGAMLLGLATAVKWTAAPYVAFAGLGFLAVRAKRPQLWAGLGTVRAILLLGVASIGIYFVTFIPALYYREGALTVPGLVSHQLDMFHQQTQVLDPHPYQSGWTSWALLIRPIWYLYEPVDGAVRGILLIGNPVVMWGGLVAVAALGWAWWRDSNATAGAIALLWLASLGIWAAIPKSLGFYYYYHLSGIFLCVALGAAIHIYGSGKRNGWVWWFAVGALAMFVYFYPIISAAALPNDQAFNRWMWLDSWR